MSAVIRSRSCVVVRGRVAGGSSVLIQNAEVVWTQYGPGSGRPEAPSRRFSYSPHLAKLIFGGCLGGVTRDEPRSIATHRRDWIRSRRVLRKRLLPHRSSCLEWESAVVESGRKVAQRRTADYHQKRRLPEEHGKRLVWANITAASGYWRRLRYCPGRLLPPRCPVKRPSSSFPPDSPDSHNAPPTRRRYS